MIKVKITSTGGYVVGDGNLPEGLDPDTFMKMFMNKIIEAKVDGVSELDISEEELAEVKAGAEITKKALADELDEAPVIELADDASMETILDNVYVSTVQAEHLLDQDAGCLDDDDEEYDGDDLAGVNDVQQ